MALEVAQLKGFTNSMETNVNYTIVGAFVIILTAAIVFILIWLSSGFSSEKYNIYRVMMREAVSGLNIGAPVEFNGVNVGTVSSIEINRKNPQLVELLLKIKHNTPVTNGTRAKLDIRSLSGTSYMQLEDKGNDMRPLKILAGQKYPIIPTTPSIIVRISSTLTQLTNSFNQISVSIQRLLSKENLISIRESLINLRKFTYMLSKDSDEIDSFLQNANKASLELKVQTLPAASRAITNFGNLSTDISKLSTEIKQNPAVLIRGKSPQPLGPGE